MGVLKICKYIWVICLCRLFDLCPKITVENSSFQLLTQILQFRLILNPKTDPSYFVRRNLVDEFLLLIINLLRFTPLTRIKCEYLTIYPRYFGRHTSHNFNAIPMICNFFV